MNTIRRMKAKALLVSLAVALFALLAVDYLLSAAPGASAQFKEEVLPMASAITTTRITFSVGVGQPGDIRGGGYLLGTGPGHLYLKMYQAGIQVGGAAPVLAFVAYRIPAGEFDIELKSGQELWGMLQDFDTPTLNIDLMFIPND